MDKQESVSESALRKYLAVTFKQLEPLWTHLECPEKQLPVMDVGCGSGDIAAKFLAPRLPSNTKIVACDLSQEKLEYAKEHNAVPGVVTYELFNVETDDLQSSAVWKYRPYGKVFALQLLHWVPNNRLAIRNINQLLAPGGEVVFTVLPKVHVNAAYEEVVKNPRWKDYMKDIRRFISPYQHSADPAGELRQLLEEEGFKVLYCWFGPKEVLYSTDDEIRYILKSVNPFLDRIPEEEKDNFIEEILQWIYKLDGLKKEKDSVTGEERIRSYHTNMEAVAKKL